MKKLDRYLQHIRIKKASAFINPDAVLLDVGSSDGVLFEKLKGKIGFSYGIDPTLHQTIQNKHYQLIKGDFPEDLPSHISADTITLLAVLEHIPKHVQQEFANHIHKTLKPKGRLIITVPSDKVDYILKILLKLRLIEGMSLEEHYGFKAKDTLTLFSKGFKLIAHKKFQFGLNNLFVFEKVN